MARYAKWLKGVSPEQPASLAASKAIEERLNVLWENAARAANYAEEDNEHVHQLRVATRRSVAALKLFRELLSRKRTREMKTLLVRMRRAAGDARDLDVLRIRLEKMIKQSTSAGLELLLEEVRCLRAQAQTPLKKTYRSLKRKEFPQRIKKLVRRVKWRGEGNEPEFADAARTALKPIVNEFFDTAAADLSDVKSLHQMRISGKRLRYAMELLAAAFDPSFREELYPIFTEVQRKLGTVNDHATALRMYDTWNKQIDDSALRDELQRLADDEQAQLARDADSFRQWWTDKRSAALEQKFAEFVVQRISIASSCPEPDCAPDSANNGQQE